MGETANTMSTYPYQQGLGKEIDVDVAAKVTAKGQITIPKVVREALGIEEGDQVVFRVEGKRAVLARTPNFIDLAGTVEVPADKRNMAWDQIIREARAAWVSRNL